MPSYMCPKGIHFSLQMLVLEVPNSTQHLCFLAHGIKSSFEVVLVSLGGRIWTSFGMHLGGPGRATSVFRGLGQPLSVFSLSNGFWAWFWKVFGPTFGRRELIFWLLEEGNCECVRASARMVRVCAGVCMCVCTRVRVHLSMGVAVYVAVHACARACVRASVCLGITRILTLASMCLCLCMYVFCLGFRL